MVWVNVEAALAVLDDLRGASVTCGECRQAAGHGLNNCQTKRLIQSRLQMQFSAQI